MVSIFAGNNFVRYTGAVGSGIYYFLISTGIFFVIYILYFMVTYISFKKNIEIQR